LCRQHFETLGFCFSTRCCELLQASSDLSDTAGNVKTQLGGQFVARQARARS
jgi:hypothetical protein